MKKSKIINVVFYKSIENGIEAKKACIFYRDGSVLEGNYEEGIDACEEIVQEKKITSIFINFVLIKIIFYYF